MAKSTALIIAAVVLMVAGSANANGIVRGPSIPSLAVFLIAGEALLATIILSNLGFKPLPTFIAWLALTSITFVLFFKFLRSMESVPLLLKAVTGEIWVIILEALALYCAGLSTFLRRNHSTRLKPAQALKVSAVVNLASMLMGFVLPV